MKEKLKYVLEVVVIPFFAGAIGMELFILICLAAADLCNSIGAHKIEWNYVKVHFEQWHNIFTNAKGFFNKEKN